MTNMSKRKPRGAYTKGLAIFKVSKKSNNFIYLVKTFLYASLLWLVFLYIILLKLSGFERTLGISLINISKALSWSLFLLASFGILYTAYAMAIEGKGTPLPLDTARELVVKGPYKYVRTPWQLRASAKDWQLASSSSLFSPLAMLY